MENLNILIVGVGGQGTLLASVLLGNLGMQAGYDVKLSEVHGMAQRGGSVVTHVRFAKDTSIAPTIDTGSADIIVAFEQLEGFRWASYLKKGGKMFINTQKISPMPVIMGVVEYPSHIMEFFSAQKIDVSYINAEKIAEELGNSRVVNTILLGAAAKEMPFSMEDWLAEIEKTIRPQFVDVNKRAFLRGMEA
ncbi:MAG: indolepyruvate oxidoreductase subunit beta [Christensenellaceae bacterium]|jgi:indolepyruvate ferredoxin oxidoreductase beta subunit